MKTWKYILTIFSFINKSYSYFFFGLIFIIIFATKHCLKNVFTFTLKKKKKKPNGTHVILALLGTIVLASVVNFMINTICLYAYVQLRLIVDIGLVLSCLRKMLPFHTCFKWSNSTIFNLLLLKEFRQEWNPQHNWNLIHHWVLLIP